jgi:hypothetical protein
MPMHDWTRVDAETFDCFQTAWLKQLGEALNGGLLPAGYYAKLEEHQLVIRHSNGNRLIAVAEIVAPASKDQAGHVAEFVDKVESALWHATHLLLIDMLPPGPHDPVGMHGAVWARFEDEPYEPPDDGPLTLASYIAKPHPEGFVGPLAVGIRLPEIPLFLTPERSIEVPMEETYMKAFRGLPDSTRALLEGPGQAAAG